MSSRLTRIITIFLWVLMAVSVVFAGIFYFGEVVPETVGSNMEEPVVTQSFLTYAYILFGLAVGITLIFSLLNVIFVNPKGLKMLVVALVGFAIVFFVARGLADDTVLNLPNYDGKDNVPNTLKWADTGLFTTYILAGLAVVAILWDGVSKVFK